MIKPHWPVPTATRGGAAGFGRTVARGTRTPVAWGCAEGVNGERWVSRRRIGSGRGPLIGRRVMDADCASNAG